MYSTCLFCHKSLGANEAVESFPVGRRLAFDQRQGRLWVVCVRCRKWNLTPLEERFEAIEACERLYRDARKRASTDQIGLAKLSEGLELVRIGEPLRPEFAAWRYGGTFVRRRLAFGAALTAGFAGAGFLFYGTLGGGTAAFAAQMALQGLQLVGPQMMERRVVTSIVAPDGRARVIRRANARSMKLLPARESWGWGISLHVEQEGSSVASHIGRVRRAIRRVIPTPDAQDLHEIVLEGDEARRVAARALPHVVATGGTRKQTASAVERIESNGGPEGFLNYLARNPRQFIIDGSHENWLGVEMAVNEENERRALEDELRFLELAWEEAEEIAKISDKLLVPGSVDARLASLKQGEHLPR